MNTTFNPKTIISSLLITGFALGHWWNRLSQFPQAKVMQPDFSEPSELLKAEHIRTDIGADKFLNELWEAAKEDVTNQRIAKMLDPVDQVATLKLLARCEKVGESEQRNELRQYLFERLSELDPEAALSLADRMNVSGRDADHLLAPLLVAWKSTNPEKAEEWFLKRKGSVGGSWETLDYVFKKEQPPVKEQGEEVVPNDLMDAWRQTQALMAKNNPGNASMYDFAPLWRWAQSTNRWAEALGQVSLMPELHRSFSRSIILSKWAEQDLRAVLDWRSANPFPKDSSTSEAFELKDIYEAAAGASLRRLNPQVHPHDREQFMAEWTQVMDAGYAVKVVGSNLQAWTEEDPTAASAWLNAQKDKRWRDAMADMIAQTTVVYEPESAMVWAQSIREGELRDLSLISCWTKWHYLEPDSADAWMKANVPDFLPMQERVRVKHHNLPQQ